MEGSVTGPVVALVPAAGRGLRLLKSEPKAFVDLGGSTLLQRSVDGLRASGAVDRIVVMVPVELVQHTRELLGSSVTVVAGASVSMMILMWEHWEQVGTGESGEGGRGRGRKREEGEGEGKRRERGRGEDERRRGEDKRRGEKKEANDMNRANLESTKFQRGFKGEGGEGRSALGIPPPVTAFAEHDSLHLVVTAGQPPSVASSLPPFIARTRPIR